jgi:hypothetical protein
LKNKKSKDGKSKFDTATYGELGEYLRQAAVMCHTKMFEDCQFGRYGKAAQSLTQEYLDDLLVNFINFAVLPMDYALDTKGIQSVHPIQKIPDVLLPLTSPEEASPEEASPEEASPEEASPEEDHTYQKGVCAKCHQTDQGQTGQYPCELCGVPTLHDRETAQRHPSAQAPTFRKAGIIERTGQSYIALQSGSLSMGNKNIPAAAVYFPATDEVEIAVGKHRFAFYLGIRSEELLGEVERLIALEEVGSKIIEVSN